MKNLLCLWAAASSLALQAAGFAIDPSFGRANVIEHPDPVKRQELQDIVTWDNASLIINGERLMIFSAEVHPFRLPVPSLWLDVFQKVKALGFNCVSFYVDWALVEGKSGDYSAEGIFALEPFFDAATEAGIYLLARPGPYINAEVSGGGFPGWLSRIRGTLRTSDPDYLNATDNYIAHVASTVAKAQITNGGPIILYQPENEYSYGCCGVDVPDGKYMQYVIDQARDAGVVVPMISNDVDNMGISAPGTGVGEVDIYGHDNYPLDFDCENPTVWPEGSLPTDWRQQHLESSPTTPYSILEFQAGAYGDWGGPGFDKCSALANNEFERVFYKNNIGFGIAIFNLYMTFGGTNWGNLGQPDGYTSYDYGAPIEEDRRVAREKYSELKLIGNFIKTSPSYLNAVPGNLTDNTNYTSTKNLTVTPLIGRDSDSSFFVLRHSKYESQNSTKYELYLPTSAGNLTIPQLGGKLTLNGRDSKIHVTDYDVAGTKVLYSTAEIFTWKKFHDKKVLVVYGGPNELHELAVAGSSKTAPKASIVQGCGAKTENVDNYVVVNWVTSSERHIVKVDDLEIFLIDRNSAYNYWVPELPKNGSHPGYPSPQNTESSIIVKAGYLVRTAYVDKEDLHITADFNATTPIEVIGAPEGAKNLYINGGEMKHSVDDNGIWTACVEYEKIDAELPNLRGLDWKYIDAMPELQDSYDDSPWPVADHKESNSPRNLTTPTSLYSNDYGFHTGFILYRGHFVADGSEKSLHLETQAGTAFGNAAWLNGTFLGSWAGDNTHRGHNDTFTLSDLKDGEHYVVTVLIDTMGMETNWTPGNDEMKAPRGILDYKLSGRDKDAITWKLTGNLGGEDYADRVRGPLNEGGLSVERQGWHQPKPPSDSWESANPVADGMSGAGVGFFSTSFDLDLPTGWDISLGLRFANDTENAAPYRVQLYVNGYQFGKYVSNVGPQQQFPVPQGVLDYQGTNWLGITLWSLEDGGATVDGLKLNVDGEPVMTALKDIAVVDMPAYEKREGAY